MVCQSKNSSFALSSGFDLFDQVDSGVKQFVEAMRGQVKSIKAKQCTAVAEPLTSKEGNPPAAAPAAGKKADTGGKKEE